MMQKFKKVVPLIIVATSVLLTPITTARAESLCGDVNKDGVVDSSDASIVLDMYAKSSTGSAYLDEEKLKAADVNGDGAVDSSDASRILELYAINSTGGEITEVPTITATLKTKETDEKEETEETFDITISLDKEIVLYQNKRKAVKYTMEVKNIGGKPGYVRQLAEKIPQGLTFEKKENVKYGWIIEPDGSITTEYLKDNLLQPGETAEVEVIFNYS